MSRVAAILQSGSVMSQRFQVYESHLSFILQFMCDFGLYGCGSIEIGDAYRRTMWDADEDIQSNFKASHYPPQTRMALELDIVSAEILNRARLTERKLHHRLAVPGPGRPSEPIVTSIRELWDDERNRRRARGLDPSPELPEGPNEASRVEANGGWMAEARWWDEIHSRLEQENSSNQPHSNSFSAWENQVMSIFESTEALWEAHYQTWRPVKWATGEPTNHGEATVGGPELSAIEDGMEAGEVFVNEVLLANETMDDLEYIEEAESGGEEEHGPIDDEAGDDPELDDAENQSEDEVPPDASEFNLRSAY